MDAAPATAGVGGFDTSEFRLALSWLRVQSPQANRFVSVAEWYTRQVENLVVRKGRVGSSPITDTMSTAGHRGCRTIQMPAAWMLTITSRCSTAVVRTAGGRKVAGSIPVTSTNLEDVCKAAIAHVSIAPRRSSYG